MVLFEIEEQLKKVMTQEISLFSLYKDEFNKMKNLVMEKDWIPLQRSFETMLDISKRIEAIDSKRDDLYSKLYDITGSKKDESFYSLMSKIHKNGNSEITDIYRIVKHEANSVKILNEGFNKFVNSRKNLVTEIIEELVPDRKGTIYNRQGFSSHEGRSTSIILNKHL